MFNAIPVCGERDLLLREGEGHWKMSSFQAGKLVSCTGFFFFLSQTVLNSNSDALRNLSF